MAAMPSQLEEARVPCSTPCTISGEYATLHTAVSTVLRVGSRASGPLLRAGSALSSALAMLCCSVPSDYSQPVL